MKTEDYYTKRHKVYLENCQQVESYLNILSLHLPSAMESLSLQDDVCKVLSVGSGHGKVDLQVLKSIKKASEKKVYNRVIEPNDHSFKTYKQVIANELPPELSGGQAIFDLTRPQTFQEYMAKNKTDSIKFDVVHFIHSIYFVDMEEALTHCYYNELGDRGLIICILEGENHIIPQLFKKLHNTQKSSENITDIIKKNGWKYQHYSSELYVDVTEVFDDQSEVGNLLLDFLTQTTNFRATMDSQKIQEVIDMIKETSETIGGKRLSENMDNCTFIFK